jgi:hypothetical protein
MDQEDPSQIAHLAVGETGSTTPQDARPTVAEESGASSGGDLLGRLRELQDQVARLAAEAAGDDGVVPGAGTRIVIVPSTPRRPELPPRGPGRQRQALTEPVPEPVPRSEAERRAGAGERRGRRDRRRRDVGPGPAGERRGGVADRRSGRGDRRLGHDRRAGLPRRPRREHRGAMLLLAASGEVLLLAAAVLALVRGS